MSYNITATKYLSGKLKIATKDAFELQRTFKDETPECCFLDEVPDPMTHPDDFAIESPWWYGSGSGGTYYDFIKDVLGKCRGPARILFVWEGGDSFTVLAVDENGVVTEEESPV